VGIVEGDPHSIWCGAFAPVKEWQMKKEKAKTSMARLLTFDYQNDESIMVATGADIHKICFRAALCVERQQQPGFALYDAIERGRLGGAELLALATIGLVHVIQSGPPGVMVDLEKRLTEEQKEMLREMPDEVMEKLSTEVRDIIRKVLDE
jgi:hypothetical protein